ncbi:MAG: hypothetical protein WA789_18675 [Candidatus Acidiferrum sp.]
MPNLFSSLWPGLLIWLLLYVSDYALTIVCARLYRSGVNEKLVIEGSFELNPYFQRDIDALKVISPRFLAMLLITGLLLTLMWIMDSQSTPEFYEFVLGAMVLLEVAVHVRHIRNFFTFRMIGKSDCVRGRIEYSRPFSLRVSSTELFAFSGLFLILFAFTPSWFVLGGAASCALAAIKHRRLAKRVPSKAPAAVQPQSTI